MTEMRRAIWGNVSGGLREERRRRSRRGSGPFLCQPIWRRALGPLFQMPFWLLEGIQLFDVVVLA